jgi:hypothetical protein
MLAVNFFYKRSRVQLKNVCEKKSADLTQKPPVLVVFLTKPPVEIYDFYRRFLKKTARRNMIFTGGFL